MCTTNLSRMTDLVRYGTLIFCKLLLNSVCTKFSCQMEQSLGHGMRLTVLTVWCATPYQLLRVQVNSAVCWQDSQNEKFYPTRIVRAFLWFVLREQLPAAGAGGLHFHTLMHPHDGHEFIQRDGVIWSLGETVQLQIPNTFSNF